MVFLHFGEKSFYATGLFIASGSFDTPLISVIYGRILKPFGVVIVTTVRFCLVYNNACQVARYLWKYCTNSGPIFELSKFSGNGRKSNIYKVTPSPPYGQRGAIPVFYRWFFTLQAPLWPYGGLGVTLKIIFFLPFPGNFILSQNCPRNYAIFTEVPDHLSSIVIHQTKPNSSDYNHPKRF